MNRKEKRLFARTWLENEDKIEYADLMDRMEAGDLRSIVLTYVIQQYDAESPDDNPQEMERLRSYYTQPLKFQKEILSL